MLLPTRDPNVATRQRDYPPPLGEEDYLLAPIPNPAAFASGTPMVSPGPQSQKRRSRLDMNLQENKEEFVKFWDRFTRKGKKKIGVKHSLRSLALSSWLNILLILIPLSWVSRFLNWGHGITFALSFFAIVPLERLFDYGGEQMAHYLGKDLGDLLMVTLNNTVEATLAIILLARCELQLLKATIIGVVILHLLLVPGTAFVTGGARVVHQNLHPHSTELNHSLLSLGVLSLLLPAAFFAALDTGFSPSATIQSVVNDHYRGTFLKISRGIAVLLLIVYICSRIYLHNPPGTKDEVANQIEVPEAYKAHVAHLRDTDPEVNQWICLAMLVICIGLMATTAEWLVESIERVREVSDITLEWFGLILLPFVSFAADGAVAVVYFARRVHHHYFHGPRPPPSLAKAEAIDLSIQFTMFWMPFLVLLAWWTHRPLTLLFDLFEVAVIIGSCFIVNYVTADSKTNWAEGVAMISFYCMIALCAWYYPGQPEIPFLSQCESVVSALAKFNSGGGGGE